MLSAEQQEPFSAGHLFSAHQQQHKNTCSCIAAHHGLPPLFVSQCVSYDGIFQSPAFGRAMIKIFNVEKSQYHQCNTAKNHEVNSRLSHSCLLSLDEVKYNSNAEKEQSQKNTTCKFRDRKRAVSHKANNQSSKAKLRDVIKVSSNIISEMFSHNAGL